jgi:hypothetical protein
MDLSFVNTLLCNGNKDLILFSSKFILEITEIDLLKIWGRDIRQELDRTYEVTPFD